MVARPTRTSHITRMPECMHTRTNVCTHGLHVRLVIAFAPAVSVLQNDRLLCADVTSYNSTEQINGLRMEPKTVTVPLRKCLAGPIWFSAFATSSSSLLSSDKRRGSDLAWRRRRFRTVRVARPHNVRSATKRGKNAFERCLKASRFVVREAEHRTHV